MTATTNDRNTLRRDALQFHYPIAADTKIPAGVIVCLLAGVLVNGVADDEAVTVGVSEVAVDNTDGAASAEKVPVRRGCFQFGNSASGDAITLANVGSACYVVDNQTVAKTSDTGARPVAGIIRDVDSNGVWVEI